MDKTIYRRMQQRCDTEANWNSVPNFIPLQGEIIVYVPDINNPISRFKIGDGLTSILKLPFISDEAQTIPTSDIEALCV